MSTSGLGPLGVSVGPPVCASWFDSVLTASATVTKFAETTELKPKAVKLGVQPLPPGTTQAPTPAGAANKAMAKVGVHPLPPGTTHSPTPAGEGDNKQCNLFQICHRLERLCVCYQFAFAFVFVCLELGGHKCLLIRTSHGALAKQGCQDFIDFRSCICIELSCSALISFTRGRSTSHVAPT